MPWLRILRNRRLERFDVINCVGGCNTSRNSNGNVN